MKQKSMKASLLSLPVVLAVIFSGLPESGKTEGVPPATGSVEGRVYFTVDPPSPGKIKVNMQPDVCGASQISEEFIVSVKDKGLKNVVMTLSGGSLSGKAATHPRLEQNGCRYEPHVQVAQVSDNLKIVNSDPVFHNVHGFQVLSDVKKTTLFNLAQPAEQKGEDVIPLTQKGLVEIVCDVHNWMKSYVVVHDNPFFSVSDAGGNYRIKNVPPGEYTLTLWHEGMGKKEVVVTVSGGKATKKDFPIGG